MKNNCAEQNEMLGKSLRMQMLGRDCPAYAEQETWKEDYRFALERWQQGKAALPELVAYADRRFQAWYFRSAKLHPKTHPVYPAFAAMLLNQEHFRSLFPGEVIEKLVERYGKRKGIERGSYWMPRGSRAERAQRSFGELIFG